jgi:uncharacterized protein (DUF983 family)
MSGAGPDYPPVSPLTAALFCRCPRCGEGKLYNGLLTVAPRCKACDLDLAAQDAGDGPAVFVILILGALVVALAIFVEVTFAPPIWVHLLLWTPVIIGGAILLLRPLKAWLIAMQYRHHLLERADRPRA